MNILNRKKRDREIAEFLCTEVEKKNSGKPRYKTLQEASEKYDLSFSHTSRLKTLMINEIDGIRTVKEEYVS